VQKAGTILSAGGTFTQEDLDSVRVTYTHDGSATTSDRVFFIVSDGAGGLIGTTTFSFTIIQGVPSIPLVLRQTGPPKELLIMTDLEALLPLPEDVSVAHVIAEIDTNGVAVDINGAAEGRSLELALWPGTVAEYADTTEGLGALRLPVEVELTVSALATTGDTLGQGVRQFAIRPIPVWVGIESGAAGRTTLVPVIIGRPTVAGDDVAGSDIRATSVDISFERDFLRFEQVLLLDGVVERADHRMVANDTSEANQRDALGRGHIQIRTAGASPLPGEGTLFFVRFRVLETFPQQLTGNLADVMIERVLFETVGGEIVVATSLVAGGVSPLLGDVNRNGAVTAFDGVMILKSLVRLLRDAQNRPIVLDLLVADVNRDKDITALDAAYVFYYDATGTFPTGATKPVMTGRTIEVVAGRWVGKQLVVPIRLDDLSGLMAGELTLMYDPAVVEVGEVTPTGRLEGWQVVGHAEAGILRVAFAGLQVEDGAGEILHVALRPRSHGPLAGHPLTLIQALLNDQPVMVVGQEAQAGLPTQYALFQNMPNPFNPETQIGYDLPQSGHVTLTVYNVMGQVIRVLVDGDRQAGRYTIRWEGNDAQGQSVASGIYVYRLTAGAFTTTKRMVLLR
jgi:hypothetical protein